MSEFVEEGIEGLLPVFEILKGIQLLAPAETDAFVKRCKSFEYRLQKARKDPQSFKAYIDYLISVMKLIRMRRKRMKYSMREDEIEGAIKTKIANLYRQCCERFQARKDVWLERIEFLKNEKMYTRCSKAYFRALQIFPRDNWMRIEAARFEYLVGHRMESARSIMQQGLRLNQSDTDLWMSLAQLELDYVKWLVTRKSILTGRGYFSPCAEEKEVKIAEEAQKNSGKNVQMDEKSEKDAVLGLRVVEVVIKQALESCNSENKSALLLGFWRTVRRYGLVAGPLTDKLYKMLWSPKYKSEESWIAKSELIDYDQDSLYELLDRACEDRPTEKMHRYYLGICKRHHSFDRDPDAKRKCREVLFWLIGRGYGTNEDIIKFDQLEDDSKEKEKVLNNELQNCPTNAFLWMMLLRCKIKSNPDDTETIRDIFNKATKETFEESRGVADIYKIAVDWALKYSLKDVEPFFAKAVFHAPPNVACEMRCIRLNYLKNVFPKNPELYRDEYFQFVKHPPNSIEVHRTFIRNELRSEHFLLELIIRSLECMVLEFGDKSYECWIDYAECLMKYDPTSLQAIHRRALASLPPLQVEMFLLAYNNLLQMAPLFQENGDDDDVMDDDDDDDDDVDNDDDANSNNDDANDDNRDDDLIEGVEECEEI